MSKCICGEINARHCPVHNESVNHREWWINLKEIEIWEMKENAPEGSILVVEYSAFEQLREENEQLKLQIQKERRKSEAEIHRLKNMTDPPKPHIYEGEVRLIEYSAFEQLSDENEELKKLYQQRCEDCDRALKEIVSRGKQLDTVTKERDELAERFPEVLQKMALNEQARDATLARASEMSALVEHVTNEKIALTQHADALAEAIENYCNANRVAEEQEPGSCYDQFNKALAAWRKFGGCGGGEE